MRSTQIFSQFCFLLCLVFLSWASIAHSVINPGPTSPTWVGESNISSDDGYADLVWELPSGEYAPLFLVTETRPGEPSSEFYVYETSARIFRLTPDRYGFRVSACEKDSDGYPICGNPSNKLHLTVTDQAIPQANTLIAPVPDAAPIIVADGPSQLRPGGWVNPNKDAQAWYFYWANRLSLPETDPMFANVYDLVGIWYTFEAKSVFFDSEVCQCNLYSDYLPVTAELKLVKLNATTYSGGLWITRNGVAAQVGGANVIFGVDSTHATVNWSATFKNEVITATSDGITNTVNSDPASTNNHSHYGGQWQKTGNNTFFVDDLITDWVEVVNVTFEDSVGDPVWVQATSTVLLDSNVNFCLQYLNNGYRPNQGNNSGTIYNSWYENGCDANQASSGTNRNGRRYFSGFDSERLWATFTLPGTTYSTGSVTIGSSSNPEFLDKLANYHGIFFSGANSCQISTSTPSCDVDLTWFTDSDYPTATAFAFNTTTGVRTAIFTSPDPAEVNYIHALNTAGVYEFELRMGNTAGSTLIANSGNFSVTQVTSSVPVAPTNLSVAWTNEPNRDYQLQWQHANSSNVDYYQLQETLPNSSIVNHNISPSTIKSKAFSRLAGPFGSYSYRVRACNTHGCGSYTSVTPWTVTQPAPSTEEHPWGDNQYGALNTGNSGNYGLGYHFKALVDGQITQLGGYFDGNHEIKLFIRGEPELGKLRSAMVASNNSWSYVSITPINISAGTEYTVAVYTTGGDYSYRSSVGLPDTYGAIQILASTWIGTNSNPDAIPTNSVTDHMYGQVDIGFVAGIVNEPPTITNPPANQTNKNGVVISIDIDATDPESEVLFFNADPFPSNISINGVSGQISGTLNDTVGIYNAQVFAHDQTGNLDSAPFTWTIQNTNPVVFSPGNQSNDEGQMVSRQISASDIDPGDTLSYGATGLPTGLSINTNSGFISGTVAVGAKDSSPYSVTVTVNDTNGGSQNTGPFTWTIFGNTPPVITNPGNQVNQNHDAIIRTIVVTDPDAGDVMSYSATGFPANLSINASSGVYTGTLNDLIGVYSVTVTVDDGNGGVDSEQFTWIITNAIPVVLSPGNQTDEEGQVVSLPITAWDVDPGETLTYSATGLPTGLSINTSTGLISGTVAVGATALSPFIVTVTVNDSNNGSGNTGPFSWAIGGNTQPTINIPSPLPTRASGVAIAPVVMAVTDADSDPMTCSDPTASLPAGLTVAINAGNTQCEITGTVSAPDAAYPVSITVDDGKSGITPSDLFNFTISTTSPGTPETPPLPASPPDMTPTIASSEVGATAGQFRVDESGSATYSIPILTAPGSGGIAPQISLNYSSQSSNGPLGVGWSLGGISAITRCSQTIEQDIPPITRGVNLTTTDRFCLDGQRLFLVSGTYEHSGAEYRTEIDGIARIKSVGNANSPPTSFTVERKDGSTSHYGNSTDSRIEAGSAVLTWAQNRFEDSAGNYILYHYDETSSPVEFVIDQIEYTGNSNAGSAPYAKMDFIWTSGRGDTTNAYVSGTKLQQTKVLARIDSQARKDAGSAYTSLRSYFLTYANDGIGRRSLRSIEECNNVSKQACLNSTDFNWLNSLHRIDGSTSAFTIWPNNTVLYGLQLADISGDGRPDILYTNKTGNGNKANYNFKIKLANSAGGFGDLIDTYNLPKKADGLPPRVFGIDLNADGFQDVVYRNHLGSNNYSWIGRLSDGTGLGGTTTLSTSNFVFDDSDPDVESNITVLDANGDGLSDLLYNRTDPQNGDQHDLAVIINTYSPGGPVGLANPQVISSDFSNLSGNDLFPLYAEQGTFELSPKLTSYETYETFSNAQTRATNRVFDFNGDGAVDILLHVWRQYDSCDGPCTIQSPVTPTQLSTAITPIIMAAPKGEPPKNASFWVLMISDFSESDGYRYEVVGTGRECNLDFCLQYPGVPGAYQMWPVDINADGLADLAYAGTGNSWAYQINTGAGMGTPQTITASPIPLIEQQQVRFEDMNGDGFTDLIYPSALESQSASWMVLYNQFGSSFSAPSVVPNIVAGHIGSESSQGDLSIFADFTGDGKSDNLFIDYNHQGKIGASTLKRGENASNSSAAIAPSNVITSISNGFGALTSINYLPLTDSNVYSRMRDSSNAINWGAGSVVYDLMAPIYVVSQASNSSPIFSNTSATSRVEYHYVGAKMQAGGRGFLGFGEVISYDPRNDIRTNTRYRQDFPYTGLPVDTTQSLVINTQKFDTVSNTSASSPVNWGSVTATTASTNPTGTELSYAINEWSSLVTSGGAVFPYIADSLERSYSLSGVLDRKVLTNNTYGANGNLSSATFKTYASDGSTVFATQSTTNTYDDNTTNWHLGRLNLSTVTHSRSGQANIVRQSKFSYDSGTGILEQEIIEPNNNTYKVTTDYTLDGFGNRTNTRVTSFGMTARDARATYDALGRFVIETQNDLNHVTQKVNDWDAFGNALEVENIDGVLTFAAADYMGRPFVSYTETGGFSKTLHSTSTSSCPSGTVIKTTTTGGGVPDQIQCQDVIGRTIRTASEGFSGALIFVDQYFDDSGRPERVSEPYYSGSTLYWNLSSYDAIGRPTALVAAGGDDQILEYDNDPGIACTATNVRVKQTTNGLGQVQVEVMNALGELVDVYDYSCGNVSYIYDAVGNLKQVTGADNEGVTMTYDLAGRKTSMSDPDKGNWQYAYNSLGEMTRQRDAKSQAIDFTYDTLGRVTNRRELSNVSSLTDTTFTTHNREATTYRTASPGKGQPTSIIYRTNESGAILHQRDFIFDGFGRVDIASTTMEGTQFAEQTTYDQFGRVFQQFDATGDDHGLRSHYNAQGYFLKLQEAREGTSGKIYQEVISMDARGNATEVTLGNGVDVFATYEPASGRLGKLSAFKGAIELQDIDYLFDVLGNLKDRHDQSVAANQREQFNYDDLNRLLNVNLAVNGGGFSQTLVMTYDASGNIITKSDVGTYLYNGAQPHAVSSAGGVSYSYDNNGNQTSGDGRTITYTVFDKADQITKGVNQSLFSYGIGNSRYARTDREGGVVQKTTNYQGSIEYIQKAGENPHFKRYLGGVAVATFYPSTGAQSIEYLLKDHIGSIHTVLSESALIVTTMHFSAFGERQDTDWSTPLTGGLYTVQLEDLNNITTRGFTGHEQVDNVGIIHMNGRIYDAKLGRFLQADPIVQAPKNSQSLNRYSYVLNNPLSYTDPSGYFSLSRFVRKWGRTIVAAVASYYTFGWASNLAWGASSSVAAGVAASGAYLTSSVIGAAAAGFVSGAILSGSVNGALEGALIGAATGYIGGKIRMGIQNWKSGRGDLWHVKYNEITGQYITEYVADDSIVQVKDLFVNGQANKIGEAIDKTVQQLGRPDEFFLFHNRTHGFIADTVESVLGKVTNTSSLSRQLAGILEHNVDSLTNLTAHSQGTIIASNALRQVSQNSLTTNTIVNFNGAAVGQNLHARAVLRAGAAVGKYQTNFFDAVPNILGFGTYNPFKIIASALASPLLFTTLSPHSVYSP